MFQASKLLILSSLALPLMVNSEKAMDVSSLEVIEQNEGVILKAKYKNVKVTYTGADLVFKMANNETSSELQRTAIIEMIKDGEISTKVISYSKLSSMTTFTFLIEPENAKYSKVSQSIKYNPSQNATKYLTISERDNNIPKSTNYYKENFNLDESKITRSYQTFTSLNFEDNKVNDVYKYFDPSFFKFKYENGSDNALKGEFTFSFYDSYDLFKNFPTRGGTMFKDVPLMLNENDGVCYFTFKNKLYYEPNTRLVSYTPIEGYIETSYLYLPSGYEDKLKEIRCQLSLDIEDTFSFNVSAEFKISYIKKYFGDCSDSEYCILSQEDTNENVYEKVVDIIL